VNTYFPDTPLSSLWFLSFTAICTLLYPALKAGVQFIERTAGVLGLVLSIILAMTLNVIPLLTAKSEVYRFGHNSTGQPNVTAPWDGPYDGYSVAWMGVDYPPPGFRTDVVQVRDHEPTIMQTSSGYWLYAYVLLYYTGMVAAVLVQRAEEWLTSCQQEQEHEGTDDGRALAGAAEAGTSSGPPEFENDIEAGRQHGGGVNEDEDEDEDGVDESTPFIVKKGAKAAGGSPLSLPSISAWMRWLGQAAVSHRVRAIVADLCIVAIVVPTVAVPLDYGNSLTNMYGRGDFVNWRFGFGPLFCLFLFGSSSKGGAGLVAALFSSPTLVALGDISLAIYAFQGGIRSLFGVAGAHAGRLRTFRQQCYQQFLNITPNLETINPICLATPTDCFIAFLIFLFVVAGVYTSMFEMRLLKLIHALCKRAGSGAKKINDKLSQCLGRHTSASKSSKSV